MNEPSGLAPEVVTIRDLHIRFNLGREKKTSLFRPAAKKTRHAVFQHLSAHRQNGRTRRNGLPKFDQIVFVPARAVQKQ